MRTASGVPQPERITWHARPAANSVEQLGADSTRGLEPDEAGARLRRSGANRLETQARTTWVRVLLRQFGDVLIAILAVAAAVSFAIGEVLDACAILAILILNGLLGFLQEWRAERALAALQGMLSQRCTVLRGGKEREIDAESLVPGDIVTLASGDRVPADLRLLTSHSMKVDESALTGESVSVAKHPQEVPEECPVAQRTCMSWMGTVVTSGRGRGVVTATGMATEFGRIAELTRSVRRDMTPLQRRLSVLGRQLGLLALVISATVAATGWLLGRPALEMFMTAVSLAVAVVPEGLPAVVTVTLALGVRQMVRRRALPRRLQATETLGSATTILTDKTGTLTENEMTVSRIWLPGGEVHVLGSGYTPEGSFDADGVPVDPQGRSDLRALLEAGITCNHAGIEERDGSWKRIGEPTEAALVVAAMKADVSRAEGDLDAEFPFDSARKRMTVVLRGEGGRTAYLKGAPEVVLERCSRILDGETERELTPDGREQATAGFRDLARGGMRTLALARRHLEDDESTAGADIERQFTLLGLVGIIDPPRAEVPDAVARAMASGIQVIMLTGDAAETGLAIAERVGMPAEHAITGPELESMDDQDLLQQMQQATLFARTTPEHKLRVARLLKESGQVVGMTGDGVNDAPALKEADIGIAMGVRGTDVAREASDLVLMDDNFASIVNAVEEGRREYDNIRKFVRYLLSSNIGETIAIFITILLGLPLILLPVQILWINVVTDAVTAIALGLEPAEEDVMRRPPRRKSEPILDRAAMGSVLAYGGYIGLVSLALFIYILRRDGTQNLLLAQTVAFNAMVFLEQVNLLNHRALRSPIRAIGFFSNPWLLVALAATVLLQLAALYTPFLQRALHTTALGWGDWGLLVAAALPLFIVPEVLKTLRWRNGPGESRGRAASHS